MKDEPLKPVYKYQRPPWAGYFTGKDYNGRANWWSELGYTDKLTPENKMRLHLYSIREHDREWFDPEVENSVAGFKGEDTVYNTSKEFKGDTPGNLFDYKQDLMKSSTQYKNIAEKYKLSPEHPGIKVNPMLNRLEYVPQESLGVGTFSQFAHQWGPRFFDKPLNEGCFEKGLALAKYSAIYTFIQSAAEYQIEYTKEAKTFNYKDYFVRYAKNFPFPAAMTFGYGVSICTSATIRNRDDIYNPLYAAAFTGILSATLKDNIYFGVTCTAVLSLLGTIWHYSRISRNGLVGPQRNPMFSSQFWAGPLLHKSLDFGKAEVPKETY